MKTIGSTSVDPKTVCSGQTCGLTDFEGVSLVVVGLHNAEAATHPDKVVLERVTIMTPERAREMALALWELADSAQRRTSETKGGI